MNRFIKKRNVSRILIIGLAAIFAVGMLQAYTNKNNNENSQIEEKYNSLAVGPKKPDLQQAKAISLDDAVQVKKKPPEEIDISGVVISSEIEDCIIKADNKNGNKNIQNYKKLLKQLDVPDNYRSDIERLMKKGYIISDIFSAYEFLYENYGLIGELEGLLDKKKSGKTWAEVFKDYDKTNKEYIPSNFKPGYLEELLKDPKITSDDVMNADRVSQKGLKKFEELIKLKKDGGTWKEINSRLGIVNTAEKLPRVALTSLQVKDYEKSTGLTEKQIVDALVMAGKMEEDENEILKMVKSGSKKEDILAQHYDKKYK